MDNSQDRQSDPWSGSLRAHGTALGTRTRLAAAARAEVGSRASIPAGAGAQGASLEEMGVGAFVFGVSISPSNYFQLVSQTGGAGFLRLTASQVGAVVGSRA